MSSAASGSQRSASVRRCTFPVRQTPAALPTITSTLTNRTPRKVRCSRSAPHAVSTPLAVWRVSARGLAFPRRWVPSDRGLPSSDSSSISTKTSDYDTPPLPSSAAPSSKEPIAKRTCFTSLWGLQSLSAILAEL